MKSNKEQIREALANDDGEALLNALYDLRAEYGVKYVLEILLEKDNKHTLQSTLNLLADNL